MCPSASAVTVFADNRSADATVRVRVTGSLVETSATCSGTGATQYDATFDCIGSGLTACGTLPALRPGAWINRVAVTVTDSSSQVQARREVFVAGSVAGANPLVWTVYPRTFVVSDPTAVSLAAQLDAATAYTNTHPGNALITFAPAGFPGADTPRRIDLPRTVCVPDTPRAAAFCLSGSRLVIDGLDAQAAVGAVIWSVGARPISVLRVYGTDNVFRGLTFEGSRTSSPSVQSDTIVIDGTVAGRNRIEHSVVLGPTSGDAISVQDGAGQSGAPNAAVVIADTEITGAHGRGVIATTGGTVELRSACVHGNRGGGLLATQGGRLTAIANVIQHNLPGTPGNEVTVAGNDPSTLTRLTTDGNVMRFAGGRGLSITDHASATIRNDYIADNQFVGAKIETTSAGIGSAVPQVSVEGTAFVCNRNAGISGTCQPQVADVGVSCVVDQDCCGLSDGCCVSDPGCGSPLRCQPPFPVGLGVAVAQAAGGGAPVTSFGNVDHGGANAFAWNRRTEQGANFALNVPAATVDAAGNQWQACGNGATCVVPDIRAQDLRVASGATIELGTPLAGRASTLTLDRVVPARASNGDVVRVYGAGFNAIDGTTCAGELEPSAPCSIDNPAVRTRNERTNATRIRILTLDGTVLRTVYPDAVTPTMLVFQMPFDCFAPLVLQVAKRDAQGTRLLASTPLCGGTECAGQPAGLPCDDRSVCTVDDQCTGGAQGRCEGTPIDCVGTCLTGTCHPVQGCLLQSAQAACDDGNLCTVGDHCSGASAACVSGAPQSCAGACLTGVCDPRTGCVRRAAGMVCRAAAGACDIAESCDGVSGACPVDAYQSASLECRVSAGICDRAEHCTGTEAVCPIDTFQPSTTVCRESGAACDAPETCSGTTAACPPDRLTVAGVTCDDHNACTIGDHCGGNSDICLPGTALLPCDDGDPCTIDTCDGSSGCVHQTLQGVPRLSCLANQCQKSRLHRVLARIIARLERQARAARSRELHRIDRLLNRCGIQGASR